ncbi:hypothetical protein HDU98_004074 [Podochytrium sp. JEL0797]|nr:hypothetical protein HDU98_004074 [Podochytrium sp. JEL0797]
MAKINNSTAKKPRTALELASRNYDAQVRRNTQRALFAELRDRLSPELCEGSQHHVLAAACCMIDALSEALLEKWTDANGGEEPNLEQAYVTVLVPSKNDLEGRVVKKDYVEYKLSLDFLMKEHMVVL